LTIGQSDPLLIQRHKKTKGDYTPEDYGLLVDLIGSFSPLVTTPHILTEVSNPLGRSSQPLTSALFEGFAELIRLLVEHHVPSRELAGHEHLAVFGLTDLGILEIATSQKCLIITADSPLADYLMRTKIDVVPYDWIRKLERGT
jgi:hypothetical protein